MNRKNRGFTLLELLAAVIVIGIIGGIAMPIYTRITDEAKDNLFRDNIKSLVKNILWKPCQNFVKSVIAKIAKPAITAKNVVNISKLSRYNLVHLS